MSYSKKDFTSDQEVRWCPGCGDYAVLATMQRLLPKLNIAPKDLVFVSGIGCASRFPYYMNTFGFHTIHGRAPAVATGLKLTRPELSVWVIVGDGDGLSIGASHLLHMMRRNINVNIVMLNNRIYGLTKGQYSPTSAIGQISKTSPKGSVEQPLNPMAVALAADCSFIARAIDVDAKNLSTLFEAAYHHPGTSFIEVWQNCNVFNDGVFESMTDKSVRQDRCVFLEHQKPIVFGQGQNQGLALIDNRLQTIRIQNDEDLAQCIVHNAKAPQKAIAHLLAEMETPSFPAAMGILRQVERDRLESKHQVPTKKSMADLGHVLELGQIWQV